MFESTTIMPLFWYKIQQQPNCWFFPNHWKLPHQIENLGFPIAMETNIFQALIPINVIFFLIQQEPLWYSFWYDEILDFNGWGSTPSINGYEIIPQWNIGASFFCTIIFATEPCFIPGCFQIWTALILNQAFNLMYFSWLNCVVNFNKQLIPAERVSC